MKINEVTNGMNEVSVSGEITEISQPKDITTRFGMNRVATAKLKDETGEIQLSLWGKQIDMVSVGDKVEIVNGYTKDFHGQIQLNVGKNGSLNKL